MNKIPWVVAVICAAWLQTADAASSPMVERHVFTPGTESEKEATVETAKAVNPKELQRQLVFSGVINGPKGKKALIREIGNKQADPAKPDAGKTEVTKNKTFGIGEQIKGMTIKEIGSNYLVLAGQEGETKLNLYRGEKARPVAPVIAQETSQQPPGSPPQPPGMAAGPGQPNSPDPAHPSHGGGPAEPGVFGPGPDKSATPSTPETNTPGASPATSDAPPNPFAEVLKKAAERRANRADQQSGGPANPFLNMQQ